jgi:hypothetical protein
VLRLALNQSMQAAWTALAQRIVANTDDVGDQFAEEARKIHYGEAQSAAFVARPPLQKLSR